MITIDKIGWGKYGGFEGPYFWGSKKYTLPDSPKFMDKILKVTTSTEGGSLDAVNMYDRCVLSVGCIQYCEAVFALSRMIGSCVDAGNAVFIKSALSSLPIPLDIEKNSQGKWRFKLLGGDFLDTVKKMQSAFLGGSDGLEGHWTEEQKDHARVVALTFASMWDNQNICVEQAKYASATLWSFVTPGSKALLASDPSEDGWSGALKAAVASYSANLPAVAETQLKIAASSTAWSGSPQDRYMAACKSMALGSNIRIWPERYGKIAPVISSLFGVQTPSLSDLNSWNGPIPNIHGDFDDPLDTVKEIQSFLISQGSDLGPSGADGVYGKKTKDAVASFQSAHGLKVDGVVGPATKAAMAAILSQ